MRLHAFVVAILCGLSSLLPVGASAQERRAGVTPTAAQWRSTVERLEPAAYVTLRLRDGTERKGTVLVAEDEILLFQPRTRIRVRPVEVRYEEIAALERAKLGMSPGARVLAGTGAVVGGLFVIGALLLVGSN